MPMSGKEFSVGDLVWAKAEGFPHWPGRIASKSIEDELKLFKDTDGRAVLFFGDELTYSLVPESSIEAFEKNMRMQYKGPRDYRAEFDAALRMALEGALDCEDPPLELNEAERRLKELKYERMRDESDVNTDSERNIKRQKISKNSEKKSNPDEEKVANTEDVGLNMSTNSDEIAEEEIGCIQDDKRDENESKKEEKPTDIQADNKEVTMKNDEKIEENKENMNLELKNSITVEDLNENRQ